MEKRLVRDWEKINKIKICHGGVYFFIEDEVKNKGSQKTIENFLESYRALLQQNLVLKKKLFDEKKLRASLQKERKELKRKILAKEKGEKNG